MTLNLPRETIEKLETDITADTDPTGLTVSFAFVESGTRPSTFTAGTWDGAFTAGKATAVTPTIGLTGSAATVKLAADTIWHAYVKVADSPEIPVRACGTIKLT